MLDIDRFKTVNERHGLGAGDEMLRAFASESLAAVRVSDRLGRWGGESFVLLMSDSRAALARGGVDRLRERVAAIALPAGGDVVRVTVSAGITEHRAGETVQQTLDRARSALGEAKAQGRDRVVVA
jgi:diguanylate cyclase (GGDEF)-like protein